MDYLWFFIKEMFYNIFYDHMDKILFYMVLLVLFFIVKSFIRKMRIKIKGISGERKVKKILSKFERQGYIILHDLMLPLYEGTTQIDHVVIGPHGVTAIETKNYAGHIFGSLESKYWVQHLGRAKNEFYNPIKQNETHVKTIKYLLQKEGLHYVEVENLVVFTSKKSRIYLDEMLPVLKANKLKDWIRSYKNKRIKIERVAEALGKYKVEGQASKRAHVKQIKKAHKKRAY